MIYKQEKRFSHDAIKLMVRQSHLRSQQREDALYNQDVLQALHDLTGLPLSELAEIELRAEREKDPPFFSVKQQAMMATGFLIGITAIFFFATRLLS
ncbi:MAG: hypothetical protein CVU64_03995 [Deltaproteobacteria bacterium HGW-Deltaproteobacteria-21]|nr:MAG: hypothetical protein CVU64_03995 [Deltaproteobacteria bacterium HGW-Deltaproteobacteria-21]